MDISPLPHKLPFNVNTRIEVHSPTPDSTPTEPILTRTDFIPESPLDTVKTTVTAEYVHNNYP